MRTCPLGVPEADYPCKFCRVHLHRGDFAGCRCSTFRPAVSSYATICLSCAVAVDRLTDTATPLGKVHAGIVHEATLTFAHSDD